MRPARSRDSGIVREAVGSRFAAAMIPLALGFPASTPVAAAQAGHSGLVLKECKVEGTDEVLRCGTLMVPEDRSRPGGRRIPIEILVIPARKPSAEGPIFYFGGGPGQTASEGVGDLVGDWRRDAHDWVFVDIRGTGKGDRLDCPPSAAAGDAQHYLRPQFSRESARACRTSLEHRFDLSQYTTLAAAQDVEEVRKALGYGAINIETASFGSYLAMIYMREFPGSVRTAFLGSVVTPENRIPLHFASDSQQALDTTLAQCEADKACNAAFPRVRDDFYALFLRLERHPALTRVHLKGGREAQVQLDSAGFADALRVMLYSAETGRTLPYLIERGKAGDLSPFAEAAIRSNHGLYDSIRFGLFYSITCNEFVERIDPAEIRPATEGTFLGDTRVKAQMEACAEWPRSKLPANFFRPFETEIPTVLASFTLDNVVGPRWVGFARRSFVNSVVLQTPGGHSANNDCTDEVFRQLLKSASVAALDMACSAKVELPPFQLAALKPKP